MAITLPLFCRKTNLAVRICRIRTRNENTIIGLKTESVPLTYCIRGNIRSVLFTPHLPSQSSGEFKTDRITWFQFNYFFYNKIVSGRFQDRKKLCKCIKGRKLYWAHITLYTVTQLLCNSRVLFIHRVLLGLTAKVLIQFI